MPATGARSGGQEATGEVPRGTRRERARAHAARSKGANTDGAPRPAAAEGDRARAADGATQGREPGRGQGTGRARRGAGRAPRCMEWSEGPWASRQARAWVTGGGTHGTGRATEAWGLEGGSRARASAPGAPRDRRDGAWEPEGERGSKEGRRGAGHPRSRTCSR